MKTDRKKEKRLFFLSFLEALPSILAIGCHSLTSSLHSLPKTMVTELYDAFGTKHFV